MGKVLEVIFQRISLKITEKTCNITELLLNSRKYTVKIQVFHKFSVELQAFQNYGNCRITGISKSEGRLDIIEMGNSSTFNF